MRGDSEKHIILIGFMGTGKTTVGKVLADQLSLPLVDTDGEVERRVGHPIVELFRQRGEEAFRALEREVLLEILDRPPHIVTTGGGIVLRSDNVQEIRKGGWVVALQADRKELFRRLEQDRSRPLLSGDARTQIEKLLAERQGKYDFADLIVDTTDRSVKEVAKMIIDRYQGLDV